MAGQILPPGAPPVPTSDTPPEADCAALAQRIEDVWKGKAEEVRALNPLNNGIERERNVLVRFGTKHDDLQSFWRWLRDKEKFGHCSLVLAIDHLDHIEVKHLLFNYDTAVTVETSAQTDRLKPKVPSASLVWRGANWLEREQYDMFGVDFEGHPDQRRVLLPDDWIGFPLRKDFEYRQAGEWW